MFSVYGNFVVRYRGYYYDVETKLYYLKTRYYDPEVGRFMTIDGIEYLEPETINGLNLYAYCGNNPVMNVDPEGTWSWKKFWKIFAVVAVGIVAVAAVAAITALSGGSLTPIITGALIGAVVSGGISAGGTMGNDWNGEWRSSACGCGRRRSVRRFRRLGNRASRDGDRGMLNFRCWKRCR